MKNLIELRKALKGKIEEARGIKAGADTENRSMTDEERSRFDSLMTEIDRRKQEIQDEERLQQIEMESAQRREQEDADDRGKEFRSMGEFVMTVIHDPRDSRLVEARTMSMNQGVKGGILVPTQVRDSIFQITPQEAIVRPRATPIPAGDIPDAGISFPSLNQTGAKGVYSGVKVTWTGEGKQVGTSGDPTFYEVNLEPKEVSGSIELTNKLLRNSAAAGAIVQMLMRQAILAAEDVAFLQGDGVGKPLGVLNHPATIKVNRKVANKISYEDVVNMYARALMGGNFVWVASQAILPELMQMYDAQGRPIWQPSAREGAPDTLFGRPIVYNERSPILGAKGDLGYFDFSKYLVKDGTALAITASEHVRFTDNVTIVKAVWNVDGQPWLTAPYTQENGTFTVSPFVVLDIPAV